VGFASDACGGDARQKAAFGGKRRRTGRHAPTQFRRARPAAPRARRTIGVRFADRPERFVCKAHVAHDFTDEVGNCRCYSQGQV
jgi:hypothetical protein